MTPRAVIVTGVVFITRGGKPGAEKREVEVGAGETKKVELQPSLRDSGPIAAVVEPQS